MLQTIEVVFDGRVLRPQGAVALEPNRRYMVTIQDTEAGDQDAWGLLEALDGTVEAPPDWSAEHDHYLYGTPKRNGGGAE